MVILIKYIVISIQVFRDEQQFCKLVSRAHWLTKWRVLSTTRQVERSNYTIIKKLELQQILFKI